MNKLEIIEQIEQVKRNKNNFDNPNEYYDKINSLYHKLSDIIGGNNKKKQQIEPIKQVKMIDKDELNLTDDEKIKKIENDILSFGSHLELIENTNIKL